METYCGYTGKDMFVSTDERWLINRLRKLAEEHPDEVVIFLEPENNDGCIYLKCPAKWLRINPPVKRNLSEEERAAAGERLRRLREAQRDKAGI